MVATPNGGQASGAPVTGNSITIENSVPSVQAVSASPLSGGKGDTFTCTPSGWNDLDGDAEGYAYEWKAGSQPVGGGATSGG